MSLNKVMLIGNLGDNPELKTFDSGGQVCKFPLATSETYKNRNGDKVQETEWHNVVAYGKQAEVLEKYLSKGQQVYIEGKIKTRKWEDKDGNTRYTTEIICLNFTFINNGGGTKDEKDIDVHDAEVVKGDEQPNLNKDDDDLPF